MRRILITGKDSYIGTSLERWLAKEPEKYVVDTIDMVDGLWKEQDFSPYDVVFHVAGIAHRKETQKNRILYYKVNRDLAFETAKKAKEEGVRYFIFISSMSVYGVEKGVITDSTQPRPTGAYGQSKLEAEMLISKLQEESFDIAILRPPMVYGKRCRGNYPRLAKLAFKSPFFPQVDNMRSMIYIDNLCQFVRKLIDCPQSGLFFPQNAEYVNTSEMVKLIATAHGKKIVMTKLFNPLLKLLNISAVNKAFGDLLYDNSLSKCGFDYNICGFEESIVATEKC